MWIPAPEDLRGLLENLSVFRPQNIRFVDGYKLLGRLATCHLTTYDIEICADAGVFERYVLKNGSRRSVLLEQQLTLLHELLHRYGACLGYPQIGVPGLEEAIDAVALRLLGEAGEEGLAGFVLELSEHPLVTFRYREEEGDNPFYAYHCDLLLRARGSLDSLTKTALIPARIT